MEDADIAGTWSANRNAITHPTARRRERMGRRWNLGERRCIYFLISYVVTLKDGRRSEIKSVPIVAVLADCGLIFADVRR